MRRSRRSRRCVRPVPPVAGCDPALHLYAVLIDFDALGISRGSR